MFEYSKGWVITGANFGDEGKGRMTDVIAQKAEACVRFQGGANAGHTVINEFGEFKLHQLPSGVFNAKCLNILGPGMVIDSAKLKLELEELAQSEIFPRLLISTRASLCLPLHELEDQWEEERLGQQAYGSTGRGIAPAYKDRVAKKGVLVGWLQHPETLMQRLKLWLDWKQPQLLGLYPQYENQISAFTPETVFAHLMDTSSAWREWLGDTSHQIETMMSANHTLVFEAQLGASRDLTLGQYPWTSSSQVLSAFAGPLSGAPWMIPANRLAVVKAFSSSVGTGTLVTAMEPEKADGFRNHSGEFAATTGRARDLGYFDAVATKQGLKLQAATAMALTKLDCLSGESEVKICTSYSPHCSDPLSWPAVESAEPVYEVMPGWEQPIDHIRSFSELPIEAQNYVKRIEALCEVPVRYVSVGPHRDALIEIT